MSDNWQPGDLALCVNDRAMRCQCGRLHNNTMAHVAEGMVGEVLSIGRVSDWLPGRCRCPILEIGAGRIGLAVRFQRIRPHTSDAEDAETIRLLQGKPVRERVS